MLNEWTVTYAIVLVALGIAIWRAWRLGARPRWLRLCLWLVLAGVASTLLWSILGCSVLPFFGEIGIPSSPLEWGLCVAGSSIWASVVVVFALPFYALALTWYILRWDERGLTRRQLARRAVLFGLPPALGLLYGYAAPFYAGVTPALLGAVPMAVIGWVATSLGVLAPRVGQPQLAPGSLVRQDSA